MKTKKIATMLLAIFSLTYCYAQKEINFPTTKLTINDVYAANELVYYGFDFTNFRLVEPDRINEFSDIRDVQFSAWHAFVLNEITMGKLAKWFKKTTVTYSPIALTIANSRVPDANVVARLPVTMDPDGIKKSVMNYEKPSKSGNKIGMVVNVESFVKKTNETTAYVTFFEISTGAVIDSQKVTNKSASGNGLTAYWGKSLIIVLKQYYDDIYSKGL